MTEPLNIVLLLAALVPPEILATPKKRSAPFIYGQGKVARFTDSPGRLPIGAE